MSHAYVIGHIRINDETKWADYRSRVPATLEPWGAELLFRGKLAEVLSGTHQRTDTVAIRFSDLQAARNWFYSPEYQSLIPLREEAAEVDLLLFEE
jgi:uncharacterized protein (DUF1330 family)